MTRPTQSEIVGRTGDLARLEVALADARSGHPRTILLGGEAGIGKTRLIEAFLERIPDGSAVVAVGGCPPAGDTELPFAGVVEALRSLLRGLSAGEREAVLGPTRPQLARLLPGLGPPEEGDEAGARTRLFEAILALTEQAGEARGVLVLVVEDVHWADRSTRELLAYLVRNLRDASVLIVATYRSDGIPAGHPLRVALAELDRSDRVERWELTRFDPAAVRAQLAGLLGSEPEDRVVADIATRSDGNPFFVEELAEAWRAGSLDEVPETLRETMLGRFQPLPVEVQEVLRLAAVAGWRIDPRLLAAVAPFDEPVLVAVLREAARLQLFVPVRDPDGEVFAFRQGLLREVIYAELLPLERERRHGVIAAALEADPTLRSSSPGQREAELAGHWLAADVPHRAYRALLASGRAAEASYAFPEAARFYEAALAIRERAVAREAGTAAAAAAGSAAASAEPVRRPIGFRAERPADETRGGGDTERAPEGDDARVLETERRDLVRRAAEAASLAGAPERAVELLRGLVDGTTPEQRAASAQSPSPAVVAADEPPSAAARDLLRLGRYLAEAGDTDAAIAAYDRAAAFASADPASPDVARIGSARARALVAAGRYAEARESAAAAAAAAVERGTPADVRFARETLGVALAATGEFEEGLAHLVEARRQAVEPRRASVIMPRPSRIGELVGAFADLAAVLDRAGRGDEADAASREGAELARRLGVEATWGRTLEITAARGLVLRGDWDEADRLTRDLLANAPAGAPAARIHLARARLDCGRGAFDEAAAHLEAARVHLPARPEPQLLGDLASVEAELAIWRSQLTHAREVVERAIRRLDDGEDRLPVLGLAWLGIRAEADRAEPARARRASAELAESIEVGSTLRAEALALHRRLGDRETIAPRELRVLPAFVEAEWSRLQGADDADAWATAAQRASSLPDRALAAYGLWRQAEAVLSSRGARSAAEPPLQQAWAIASELGARALAAELEALARRARLQLEPDAPLAPAAPTTARDTLGLTPREVEVLSLVAAGYTNRRIAEALFITEKTAGHHVSNVLGKLDAATRVEAAAIAHRLGLLDEVEVEANVEVDVRGARG